MHSNRGKSSYSPYSAGLRRKVSKAGGHVLETVSNRASVWLKELPRRDGLDSSTSSLADLSSPTPAGTLKRPTSLSRHASAAGFPLSPAVPRGLGKATKAYSPCEYGEGSLTEPEDISQLLADVARFAERLEKLRDVVLREDGLESRRALAHESLGDALRILRQVICKYPLLNTLETLTAAGTLISKVKGFHYESNIEADKREFEKALEMIAVSFSSTVSEFLMGEVDSSTLLSIPPSDHNQSMENLYGGIPGQGAEGISDGMEGFTSIRLSAEEVDVLLQRCEGGVEAALHYAKNVSKYMKDLIYYLEKRTALEMEFAKGLQKMVNSCKQTISQEPFMPFFSIYSLALEQDAEYGINSQQAAITLRSETFLQPLAARRLEHEKRRKEVKEQWHRAQRKLQEAESNLRKARQMYMQRSEESEKAKHVMVKAEEEQLGSSTGSSTAATKALDKKRRLEEEARNKADEAMATYRTCIADANTQKQELEDTKVTALRQLHEVVKQSDQIIKSATISFFQTMHMQTAPLPVYFQTLCESSKLYDPGQQYASHVKQLQRGDEPETQYDFEPYVSNNSWSPLARARKSSFTTGDFPAASGSEAFGKEAAALEGEGAQSRPANPERRGGFPQKSQTVPSNGTLSPGDESDGNSPSFEQSIDDMTPEISTPTGPFRHMGLSKAAQTHRLRKLRAPSKCRECNSYVYFQGAECEECYLACHKKCLETLAIQCGHKKLQGKLQLFGRDFAQQSRISSDGVPFIVKKCICEIERRAMKTKGIYRVNGVKTRVEKLCQAFENGKELVELSQAYPHDISNVLKLYLRQLPEPIMPFRMYNSLMGLAKESLQGGSEGRPGKSIAELVDRGPETEKVVVALVTKLRDLLRELPSENLSTLKYILLHLRRIVEVEQENKMTPGNLGIVFGPTLMRPRPTEATISLSSLVDYPHQARIVEALVTFYPAIFETGGALPESPEDAVQEDRDAAENQEDACAPSDDTDLYLAASAEQADAAFHEDLYREDSTRFIDSDSDPEDCAEAGIKGAPRRGSETSGDEGTPSADEASEEGTLSRTYSAGQSDSEDVSPLQRCLNQEEGRCDVDEDVVFGREGDGESAEGQVGRPPEACNTNQSNNVAFPQPPFGYKVLG
ncbi:rho GTPase-activating protein 45 isoform X3 [Zootoca vivipara]|uniref:rho GTPase-activating protein 45 isoform X3 n=1 Tax=Zootoca vivipara TaxID=8524 RepID=UPI00293B9E12|nr:rho GTPase-activating protein 45 isoform X3 [Zootoca vivipara]